MLIHGAAPAPVYSQPGRAKRTSTGTCLRLIYLTLRLFADSAHRLQTSPDYTLSQPRRCHSGTAASPKPQPNEELKTWRSQILRALPFCHLTFTSPIFHRRGERGSRPPRQTEPPVVPNTSSLWWSSSFCIVEFGPLCRFHASYFPAHQCFGRLEVTVSGKSEHTCLGAFAGEGVFVLLTILTIIWVC